MMGRWMVLRVGLTVLLISFGFSCKGLAEERYRVKHGDTLSKISKSFGISVGTLKRANGLERDQIKPSQILLIPTQRVRMAEEMAKASSSEMESYRVKQGDCLYSISKMTGLTVEEIKKENQLHSKTLKIGQVLILPKLKSKKEEELEAIGNSGEATDAQSMEGESHQQEFSEPLEGWNKPEERNLFAQVVKNFLGVPYRLGGSTLRGIDCSALVKRIYEMFNIDLPRTTREQFQMGREVEKGELKEGDLVFFKTRRAHGTHVGIYIGNREFIHASSYNRKVRVDNLDAPYFNQRFIRGGRIKELEQES